MFLFDLFLRLFTFLVQNDAISFPPWDPLRTPDAVSSREDHQHRQARIGHVEVWLTVLRNVSPEGWIRGAPPKQNTVLFFGGP